MHKLTDIVRDHFQNNKEPQAENSFCCVESKVLMKKSEPGLVTMGAVFVVLPW